MLTLTNPDPGVLDWLMRDFKIQRETHRANNQHRDLIELVDDHATACPCETEVGMFTSEAHVYKQDASVVMVKGSPMTVPRLVRPGWLHSHP